MAANNIIMHIQPHSTVRTYATAGHQSPDSQRKNNWWTPLFGWSSEPDYMINTDKNNNNNNNILSARSSGSSESDTADNQRAARSRVSSVKFTDEKARKLRMMTVETESFHDAMYHSAIASRFASDFSDRSDA